jgi:arginine:pyruvate transaminase
MHYSSLVDRIAGDGAEAWQIHSRANKRLSQGEDVILLSIGDPDFETPPEIIDRAVASLRAGRTHYTASLGDRALRSAVAAHHEKLTGQAVGAANVAIVPGAQCGLFSAALAVLNPGDEVIGADPSYVTYEGVVASAGARLVRVPLRPERRFHIDPEEIAAAVTPRTRALLLNTPHNPTGAMITPAELMAIEEIALERDLWIISDEVYAEMTFEAAHAAPAGRPGLAERCITVSSLSKSHAMTGWRLGWVVGPEKLIHHLDHLLGCMLYGSPPFIQDAAIEALRGDIDALADMKARFLRRRDRVCETLESIPTIKALRPEAGMFVMLDIRPTGMSANAFANALLDREGVSLLPGEGFGPGGAGHVRLSLSAPEASLAEACRRIARFVGTLSG